MAQSVRLWVASRHKLLLSLSSKAKSSVTMSSMSGRSLTLSVSAALALFLTSGLRRAAVIVACFARGTFLTWHRCHSILWAPCSAWDVYSPTGSALRANKVVAVVLW